MEYQFESIGEPLSVIVLMFLIVFSLAAVATLVAIASLPGWIARRRNHPQAEAVTMAGWFGLPTGIVWVLAIVWAYWRSPDELQTVGKSSDIMNKPSSQTAEQLRTLECAIERLEKCVQGASR